MEDRCRRRPALRTMLGTSAAGHRSDQGVSQYLRQYSPSSPARPQTCVIVAKGIVRRAAAPIVVRPQTRTSPHYAVVDTALGKAGPPPPRLERVGCFVFEKRIVSCTQRGPRMHER